MSPRIIESILNLLVAAFIGLMVGVVLLSVYTVENTVHHLVTSALFGMMIGTVCRVAGFLMYKYGPKNLFLAYFLTFIITLIGSILSSWGQPLHRTLLILAIAEPLALFITFLNVKYICHLNDGLKRKQNFLKQKNS